MRTRIIYEEDSRGNVIRVNGRPQRTGHESVDFDTTMRRNLYRLECEGAPFGSGEKQWLRKASWFNK